MIYDMATTLYHDDGTRTILLDNGTVLRTTEDEEFALAEIERTYEAPPTLRPHELAEMFMPDKDLKAELKQQRANVTDRLEALLLEEAELPNKYPLQKEEPTRAFVTAGIEDERARLLKRRDWLDTIITYGSKKKQEIADFNLALARAKAYPVENLVEFRHLKARCVWHEDTNPSMHWYKKNNTVYCFSCSKGGDAIDVYMALHNCSLPEAVAALQ